MDLFDDLPEPGAETKKETQPLKINWDNNSSDICSDLPPPSAGEPKKGHKRKPDEDNSVVIAKKPPLQGLYELQGFYAAKKGEREEMQDYYIILDNYQVSHLQSSISRLSFYGVFDGHGGARASCFAANNLHLHLENSLSKVDPSQIESELKRAILAAFKKTDDEFLKQATKIKPTWKDGTTAVAVLVVNNTLYIANLGDSKAILCRYNKETKKHVAIPLSKDHSPTDYMERMRIQKAGGYVRDGRVMGNLEVSRSIGDGQYKALGVSCIPDVKKCQLTDDDVFILLACDGLWKVFTSEEVLQVVLNSVKDKTLKLDTINSTNICYETACNKLANEAVRKQSGDNVTIVIVSIKGQN